MVAAILPSWHAHVDVWLIILGIEGVYLYEISRRRRALGSRPVEKAATGRQVALFSLGIATLFVGSQWPMHDLAERYLYSVHMVQHLLFMLVAPPLLICGTPVWMLRKLLAPRPVAAVWRRITKPVLALVLFNGVVLLTHWPAVVDLSVGSELFHFAAHTLLFGCAVVMWWSVVSPLPEMPALPPPAQMLYLFVQSLAPTVPASFLTFGSTPLYPVYATFPRIWGVTALTDQLISGLIMKLLGGAILWTVITVIFFRWHAQEERSGMDALQWRDVERDVQAGLSRR